YALSIIDDPASITEVSSEAHQQRHGNHPDNLAAGYYTKHSNSALQSHMKMQIVGTPFVLSTPTTSEQAGDFLTTNSYLTLLVLLAVFVLASMALGIKARSKNLVLHAHFAESERQGRLLQQKNQLLQQEMRKRQNSEKRLRTLIDTIPDAIWLKDPDGVYLGCNKTFERFLGAEEAEVIGKSDYDFADNTLADFFKPHDMATLNIGESYTTEETLTYAANGRQELLETIQTPIYDGDHQLIGILGIARNITERKQTEEKLRESQHNLTAAQEYAKVGYWYLEKKGLKLHWSEQIYDIMGLDSSVQPNFDTMASLLNATDYAMLLQSLQQSLNTGQRHHIEYRIIRGDTRAPRWIECKARPVWGESGQIQKLSGFIQDITDRKNTEEKLRTFSQVVEQNPVSVVITDPKANIQYVNRTFERITGYSAKEVIGLTPNILKSGHTQPKVYSDLWQTIAAGSTWQGELQNRRKDGTLFWEHVHITPVFDNDNNITHYLGMKEDITLQKEQEQQIIRQAHFDSLTDLPNRFLALDRLTQLIKESKRDNSRTAILFIDLDDFKKINDTLGHETGDKLLIQAAQRLCDSVRSEDTVSRLGGDEFLILLGGITNVDNIRPTANQILNRFRSPFLINGRELVLTTSIGIAFYPDDGTESVELLRNADTAMYQSKQSGRNIYHYFTESMNQGAERRLEVEEQLRGALHRREFTIQYQPIIDIGKQRIVGAEALLRWNNAALGQVPPDEFIPIAEQTGLIGDIGEHTLRQAIATILPWQEKYTEKFKVAINVSPRQFRDKNFPDTVLNTIVENNISPDTIELEITEGVLLSGPSMVREALQSLHDAGIGIAMDDFGTGYSSLSYLRSYPFNILKIDRSFINDITADKGDLELVSAAISMAHGLGLKVIAEGVETAEQRHLLTSLNCDYAQGYFFSKPVEPTLFEAMLEKQIGAASKQPVSYPPQS
ncbi:MAG: EAL domain-containing protein, partial [Chromatiales bacterium]|nr:EAL domain-containing protein [Chromatiales bacterium]